MAYRININCFPYNVVITLFTSDILIVAVRRTYILCFDLSNVTGEGEFYNEEQI